MIETEAETPETFEAFYDAMRQRLNKDEAYMDIGERPLREIVEHLCHDFCLSPEWSPWTGQGWRSDGEPKTSLWFPFRKPSPRPIDLDAEDENPPARSPQIPSPAHHRVSDLE